MRSIYKSACQIRCASPLSLPYLGALKERPDPVLKRSRLEAQKGGERSDQVMMMQQAGEAATGELPESVREAAAAAAVTAEAPPKQVALAMERLTRAARLIADVRIGSDHLLEAIFAAADGPHRAARTVELILKEEAAMRQHLDDLRALGRQLEDSGVLNGSLKLRGNSWGLHMPLVCPDGAVVAYAWKRQLAGQAGASAVDRTRLALKAFTDQKRRFFPYLEDKLFCDGEFEVSKKLCSSRGLAIGPSEEAWEEKTLSDILNSIEQEESNVRIFTYQRLDWLKRASSLSSSENDNLIQPSKDQNFPNQSSSRGVSENFSAADQVAVVELLVPSVFRAVVSLHPAGSVNPDAVAFFSPDEGGNYIHARGSSVHHVFRHITEYADRALQYFLSADSNMSLSLLLRWVCSYQTLFTKVCSKCGRLLVMDMSLALLLPPVHRHYLQPSATKLNQSQLTASATAFHIGCST